ncbi:hypothetical protein PFFCH_03174 [Plasmodium falciparum FCH/4]|uniref:Uncharacterized protein n=1 Tax=Plasmodium falciparum FCH/4 TaxID=1036724 RepID=A0A024VMC4_PLAFA|nr:hypothetical protein PFFCH_03174 [Plasmodium falciparum FCH/4]
MRNTDSEKPKVFNKNKNDYLGNVDLLATSRNGVLVKRKELLVSCVINNVMYGKKDIICSRTNFKLPTLNILDSERFKRKNNITKYAYVYIYINNALAYFWLNFSISVLGPG